MTPGWTHARAARSPDTVCGSDSSSARIAEDLRLVNCPDCQGLAETEALIDDASHGDPRVIETLREVVCGHWCKIDGVVLDAPTANAILTVYDALNDTNRAKLAAMRIDRMATTAWRLLRAR